ncbi:MerR family transcriptional regulator [Oceanobacillus jordanicus]|uniref:MerR family transcriptional regulator n=1 Tax=Oceanobacillus jordanicus TaxID=2867266 RepID=A0AAW5B4W6_9BACI|nr:MerR family transcriptional regulator [Oceanobacillus jordanicus]MCG3419451.1 MerR family transcriptional regulator [Oceanobacillus jordanicus]
MELLSFQGLCHIVGIPQQTGEHWMKEFSMYIPKTQQDNTIYFLTEAIDVMRFIKKCKYQNMGTTTITKQLAGRSFPMRVDNPQTEVYIEWEQKISHDTANITAFMRNIGTTISHVAAHEHMLQKLVEKQDAYEEHFITIKEQQMEINQLKEEIGMLQKQITQTEDYKTKKQYMANLFK